MKIICFEINIQIKPYFLEVAIQLCESGNPTGIIRYDIKKVFSWIYPTSTYSWKPTNGVLVFPHGRRAVFISNSIFTGYVKITLTPGHPTFPFPTQAITVNAENILSTSSREIECK